MNIQFLKAIPKVQGNTFIGRANPGWAVILLISMFLFSIAEPLLACCGHDPCPPCHYWNGSRCEYACYSCMKCIGEESSWYCTNNCPPCQRCQQDDKCHDDCGDPGETCCTDDPNKPRGYCCGYNKTCCKGNCCGACKTCVDGECLFCGGDPDKICCSDGSCYPKCEEVGNETLCGSEKNTSCPACVGFGGNCSGFIAKFYTNEIIYNCTGGCPGECDDVDPAPPCHEEYFCEDYIHYTFAECTDMTETGPVPLDCREQLAYPWSCTRCQQGGYYRTLAVVSRKCQ